MATATAEPWRRRCPFGHSDWERNSTPSGQDRYYCKSCEVHFSQLVDAKRDTTLDVADLERACGSDRRRYEVVHTSRVDADALCAHCYPNGAREEIGIVAADAAPNKQTVHAIAGGAPQ